MFFTNGEKRSVGYSFVQAKLKILTGLNSLKRSNNSFDYRIGLSKYNLSSMQKLVLELVGKKVHGPCADRLNVALRILCML